MLFSDPQKMEYFREIYHRNIFVNLLKMEMDEVGDGWAVLSMPTDPAIHTNLYGMSHGGALASIADTAMGVSCASLGRRVVTLELNINFIRAAAPGERVIAKAKVIHRGKSTLVVEADVVKEDESLLAKARGTFFALGDFDFKVNSIAAK